MMKNTFLLSLLLFFSLAVHAQLNMRLLDHLEYGNRTNDIWGWVDPDDSTEYALVGLDDGVSILSLADPEKAEEIGRISGPPSIWRDIKTWDNFAYVTNESSGGLLVIDLSGLPDRIDHYRWDPNIPELNGVLNSCHNLYIDEFGYCYLAGCNLNSGGIIYLDVFSEPGSPRYAGHGPAVYAHDVYVRDNLMYSSELYVGQLAIYDVSDKSNTFLMGRKTTPFEFTHNAWLSDDGRYVYTTDEEPDAPVAAYDLTDLDDIRLVDEFRPIQTLGSGVIPHNVHVWNEWLIISYYTDGTIVVDGSRPENLIEVGNFDTFLGADGGFSGVWGVYPFLPSKRVLVSDIYNGFYMLEPNYVRAARLEGVITDADTGQPIGSVEVRIAAAQANQSVSDFTGTYRTGLATAGEYEVTFSKYGYLPLSETVSVSNGTVTELNVQLTSIPAIALTGQVIEKGTNLPVADAKIQVTLNGETFDFNTDASGDFTLQGIYPGQLELTAGAWGYRYASLDTLITTPLTLRLQLEKGYADDFIFDYGWQDSSDLNAFTGFWVRDEPIGTFSTGDNALVNPEFDLDNDRGNLCFITGNGGGSQGFDDIDDGAVFLISPPIDLSAEPDASLSFSYWFYNEGGFDGQPNDHLRVFLNNGIERVLVAEIVESASFWRRSDTIQIRDHITLSNPLRVEFEAADTDPGHLVEAGIDGFLIQTEAVSALREIANEPGFQAFPNPFGETFLLNLEDPNQWSQVRIMNLNGQLVASFPIRDQKQLSIKLAAKYPSGIYLIQLLSTEQKSKPVRILKK